MKHDPGCSQQEDDAVAVALNPSSGPPCPPPPNGRAHAITSLIRMAWALRQRRGHEPDYRPMAIGASPAEACLLPLQPERSAAILLLCLHPQILSRSVPPSLGRMAILPGRPGEGGPVTWTPRARWMEVLPSSIRMPEGPEKALLVVGVVLELKDLRGNLPSNIC